MKTRVRGIEDCKNENKTDFNHKINLLKKIATSLSYEDNFG